MSTPATSSTTAPDWNANRYLRFDDERTRPARDLLAQVPLDAPHQIVDLGCGPANSTALLAERYAQSRITGLDSSRDMLEKARARLSNVDFVLGNVQSYTPDQPVNLFFSNAALHWLSAGELLPTITRLLGSQPSGAVFALQVPDNVAEPSHVSMAETAAVAGPWSHALKGVKAGRDPFPSPTKLYNALKPLCSKVDIWQTRYQHRLEGPEAIVAWFKESGLRPFLEPLDEMQQEAFLRAYTERITRAYPRLDDGGVLLGFPRLFVVATRV